MNKEDIWRYPPYFILTPVSCADSPFQGHGTDMPLLFSRLSNRSGVGRILIVLLLNIDALRTAGFSTEKGRRSFEDEVRAKIFGTDFVICCKSLRCSALKNRAFIKKIG